MIGTTNNEKQIKGVGNPASQTDAVNVKTIQKGSLNYSVATGTNNITLNLTPAPGNYTAGIIVNFIAANTITGPVTLDINGLGPVPIRKNATNPLDSADIESGQFVSVIYDGTNFQVLSELSKKCPSGFVSATDDYCIEVNERLANTWWQANVTCGNINARLCSMGEWVYACQNSGLGLTNMLNNYEWIDSAANYSTTYNYHTAKTIGMDFSGAPGCEMGFWAHPTTDLNSYRCCFSK